MLRLESDIWHELSNGDKLALVRIYKEYYDELFNYGFRISGSEDLTRDCIQELFIKIWLKKEKYSNNGRVIDSSFYVSCNVSLDGLKKPFYSDFVFDNGCIRLAWRI